MNFCNHCGSDQLSYQVPDGDHLPRYICANCHIIHYQNPNLVVGAIAEFNGKILLARRDIQPRKGFWNLPCGYLENGETVQEGAVREVFEETGAKIELGALHTIFNLPDVNQVYMIFRAQMASEKTITTAESIEVDLFSPDEIPWSEMAFESNTFALKSYLDDLKNGFGRFHIGTFRKAR